MRKLKSLTRLSLLIPVALLAVCALMIAWRGSQGTFKLTGQAAEASTPLPAAQGEAAVEVLKQHGQ